MKFLFLLISLVNIIIFASAQDTVKVDKTFKPYGKILLQVFGFSKFDITKDAQQTVNFGCSRAQIGYNYEFTKQLSAKVAFDIGAPTTVGQIIVKDSAGRILNVENKSSEGAYNTPYLKLANIQWKPSEKFILQLGGILQNHYMTQENFWAYRYIFKTFQDQYYGTASTDFGIIAFYNINDKIGIDAAITNGEGIRIKQDKFGKVKYAGGINFKPSKDFIIRLYYDNLASGDAVRKATQNLYSAFIAYRFKNYFRVGFDYNYCMNFANYNNNDLFGYSAFATYIINSKFEVLCRYDNIMKGESQNFKYSNVGDTYVLGMQYQPANIVKFSFNYQRFKPVVSNDNINYIMFNTELKL
ncbi:MAG: hypothetical protein KA792_02705 [Bacteroidales bacterium]|nr:hypothetical protein [Bacteroidales bacterium]